ncbi:MAG: NAD(P)-binding domain-containing protein [Kofleriaceae bacterium]|nr:NAD(P)-binding domain-containing protein [Kofleriaceae bacterium]MCB9572780.1 NAD(P)-binding domain-containing protein [Kofleriaceae bacterium]
MKLAIIGAGKVGTTLGRGLAAAGHAIVYGVRSPDDAAPALRHAGASVAAVAAAAAGADAVILATPWSATEAALRAAGDLTGVPVLDVTNPLGPGLALAIGHTDSGAEQVQRWAPGAHVVKVFNTTGLENMADPVYGAARVAMWVCGDDDAACAVAARLAADLGFDVVRLDGLRWARVTEPVARLWMELAIVRGLGRGVGFGLRRGAVAP